ncbi:MAG: type II toxin-antitoxin system HipA family toxin [Dongiaceae bacterium]
MKIPPGTPVTVALRWRPDEVMPVGRLAMLERRIFFQYDAAFLTHGLSLSPFHLANAAHVLGPFDTPFDGLPGVFNDSLPDGWGRLLVDRRARKLGIGLTPLDRLAIVGRHGIGALIYEPETVLEEGHGDLDVDVLAADAAATLEGDADEMLDQLIVLGGSPQGARPKAMIGWSEAEGRLVHGPRDLDPGYRHFLVKFAAQSDPRDIGPIEFAYSQMAIAAGIRMPRTHLFRSRQGAGFFGIERFDYQDNDRCHVHSLSGLLHADHRLPALDYISVLTATQRLTRDHREVMAMFRLMTFNIIAHNRDDHAKQFGFLMGRDGAWRASPAYDLTYSDGVNGEHTTMVDGEGRAPGDADILRVAKKMGIKKAVAVDIIDAVRSAVAQWPAFASNAGVTKASAREIGQVLNPAAR